MAQLVKQNPDGPNGNVTCGWFTDAPYEYTVKPGKRVTARPSSQIPGLSAESDDKTAEQRPKQFIKDFDSDYVKLAKQGGHKNLLTQAENDPNEVSTSTYMPPDWYIDLAASKPKEQKETPQRNAPDYMVHEEFDTEQKEDKYEMNRGPFDFDQETHINSDEKNVKLPSVNPRFDDNSITTSSRDPSMNHKEGKLGKKCVFPPMQGHDMAKAVNFGKLLSHGYGDDWFQHREDASTNIQK
ncbi:Hypothetical predicted protein [Pelobates cultripes]|uniref:Uncharacterized protein n=1 Tax=Pelobates cultripes TaxID=61616 RepID=A0AAD1RJY1_PELCU|nr:Hypothetical predicted protein [Pelobates cultripes]